MLSLASKIRNWRKVAYEKRFIRYLHGQSSNGRPTAKTKDKYVTYLCYAGLGNRLQAHVAAHYAALRNQRQLIVKWAVNNHFGAKFDDLFLPVFHDRCTFDSYSLINRRTYGNKIYQEEMNPSVDLVAFDTLYCPFDLSVLSEKNRWPLCEILQCLTPRPEIIALANEMYGNLPKPVIGVHIRRGDWAQTGNGPSLAQYCREMELLEERFGKGAVFYIASDGCDHEIRPILDRYQCIRMKPSGYPRGTLEEARHALVELLVLSKTNYLLLTGGSSYSNIAELLSTSDAKKV